MSKLRVIELFGGIGACTAAMKRLDIDFEVVDYVEIDKYAVASYNAINGTNFEPQDICEWDKDIKADFIMHGSPCQDFSVAGQQAGGVEGSGTRSSLLYETLRIVEKLKPRYVLWENVKNVLSQKHKVVFNDYLQRMKLLGYTNYYQVLDAQDYGIAQHRERVYVVSIRDYVFPPPKELTTVLKDYLEPKEDVDEKYYLSEKMLNYFVVNTEKQKAKGNGFKFEPTDGEGRASAVHTRPGSQLADNYIREVGGGIGKTIRTKAGTRIDDNYIKESSEDTLQ